MNRVCRVSKKCEGPCQVIPIYKITGAGRRGKIISHGPIGSEVRSEPEDRTLLLSEIELAVFAERHINDISLVTQSKKIQSLIKHPLRIRRRRIRNVESTVSPVLDGIPDPHRGLIDRHHIRSAGHSWES